jgi:hypothetical protein
MGRDRAWHILASIALAEVIRKDRDAVDYACMDDVKVHKTWWYWHCGMFSLYFYTIQNDTYT